MSVPPRAGADRRWEADLTRAGAVTPPAPRAVDEAMSRLRQAIDAEGPAAHELLVRRRAAASRARSRRRRVTLAGVVAVAAVAAGAVVVTAPWSVTTELPDVVATGEGPVAVAAGGAASCAFTYSPEVLAEQVTFAFDGTVTAIDTGSLLDSNRVTFRVDDWFRGADADPLPSITLPMAPATTGTSTRGGSYTTLDTPSYTVGTRLLVAGAARFGGGALEDPVVWGCDFTRYYDRTTAEQWADALG